MDWKEIEEATRSLTDAAAQKINEVTDLTSLYIKLKTEERRLRALYEAFGKATYQHFTTDDEKGAETIAKYVEAITLSKRQIGQIKRTIQKKREE